MSFKELNLNKGFNKPKYKEIDRPKLEKKEQDKDLNKPSVNLKIRIERQKSKSNLDSKTKIGRPKLGADTKNKTETPKLTKNQNKKAERLKKSSIIDSNHKIGDSLRKNAINPKNKIIKDQEIQKIKINPQKRYRTKPIEIKLDGYVKPVVDGWLFNVKKRQTQLRLDSGKRYISIKNKSFVKVYNLKRFYNYSGLVYRIIEKTTGKIRYGSTLGTLESRWGWYKKDALKNISNPNITPFHRRILESFRLGGDIDNQFIMRPVDICFDVNTLAQREDYWIKRHNTQDPSKGYNIEGGGVGIKLAVPISEVVRGIAYGYNIEDIRNSISSSMGLNFSRKTISRRIKNYWGGKLEAKKSFLKPVLEKIIRDGYKTNDIIHSFGKNGRNIVDRVIPQLFENKSFS